MFHSLAISTFQLWNLWAFKFYFTVPQFLRLSNGHDDRLSLIALLEGLSELFYVKGLNTALMCHKWYVTALVVSITV